MNIGFFTDSYTPQLNGVATNIEALVDTLEAKGHTVSIFAPKMGAYTDLRARVYRLPSIQLMQDPPLWFALPNTNASIKQFAGRIPDIVHLHTPFAMQYLGMRVAKRFGVPLVTTYHTLLPAHVHHVRVLGKQPIPPRLAEWYSAWSSDLCDRVIAPSEKIKASLERYGVRSPISIIRNGVDFKRFQNNERGFLRAQLGLRPTDKILLSVGRLTAEKNFGFLIEVLAKVVSFAPRTFLVLVGQGPLKTELIAQAERLGVAKNLILTGPIEPSLMPNIYADSDIFVNASLSETFSMVTLEAIASGLPAVVANDQALAAIVTHGRNGLIVPPQADAFAASLRTLFSAPDEERAMRREAAKTASEFSVETQAERLLALYEGLILEKKHRYSRRIEPEPLRAPQSNRVNLNPRNTSVRERGA